MDFRLAIFPQGSLSQSVITTVWVGVWVVCLFNLRLGWTFSGLVVPGYVVPLLIVRPWAGLIVCLEGIVAYWLVWLLSEWTPKRLNWSSVFGRDRFFALILASVAVRTASEGWVLPWVGAQINEAFQLDFDYYNQLHGFGLVIVALIANHLWKPGLLRGIGPFAVMIGTTYVLVRFGLMEFTNFNIGNLQYMYEELASSLLASPKAYIILITTAYLASRMNLTYSWDFSGILIPALLALQWYEPFKIVTSLLEAAVIYSIALLVLRLPWMREQTIEKARKVLVFFNIAFLYKMALGFFLVWYFPEARVTDYYGFGYLLSTLLAVKAHEKGIAVRLARTTLQISLLGTLAGCLIGFTLTLLPQWYGWLPARPAAADKPVRLTQEQLVELVRAEAVVFYEKRIPDSVSVPHPADLDRFAEAVRQLNNYLKERQEGQLERARSLLEGTNFQIDEIQGRYLYVHETRPPRGWGFYVLDLENPQGIVVEVPAPLEEWKTLEVGASLFLQLNGKALAVAGSGRRTNRDGSSDVLLVPRSIFQTFHRIMARRNVLQVRGHTEDSIRVLAGIRPRETEIEPPHLESSLWVKSALPPGLNLTTLENSIGAHRIRWEPAPFTNVLRDVNRSEFAELYLSRPDRRKLVARLGLQDLQPQPHFQRIDGYLQQWLLGTKGLIAENGTNLYVPPQQSDLLFFDEEVVTPLLAALRSHYRANKISSEGIEELGAVALAASVFDYQLTWYRHEQTKADYLILAEREHAPKRRFWGTFVFRMGKSKPYLVQVPRPRYERNSFEYGVTLFERLQASALMIAGASPMANQDGKADVTLVNNKSNLFNLVSQVTLREVGDTPLMVVHSRAYGLKPNRLPPNTDVVLALADGGHAPHTLTPLGQQVWNVLQEDRLTVQFVSGSPATTGYEVNALPQASYLQQTSNKEFALLWLSPFARASYRQQLENNLQESHVRALGIPTLERSLYDHLAALAERTGMHAVPDSVRALVDEYVASQDIVALRRALEHSKRCRFQRLIDVNTQQSFLLIDTEQGYPLVANLSPRQSRQPEVIICAELDADGIQHFLDTRAAWLELRRKR